MKETKNNKTLEELVVYSAKMYKHHNLEYKDITLDTYYKVLFPVLERSSFVYGKVIVDMYINNLKELK